jgi:hypothetical protein
MTVNDVAPVDPEITADMINGANLLDDWHPGGWIYDINLDALSMGNCDHCILGQLYGDFIHGLGELDLEEDDALAHGFDGVAYAALTRGWRKLIEARRAALEASAPSALS